MFVVFLGPDGAGKSTVIENLVREMAPVFRSHRVFHWRPMLLWRRNNRAPTTNPHVHPKRSLWRSLAQLVALVLDYGFGYWLLVRPLLGRSTLVVFDRYYHDLLIDPKRYRYGGPLWVVRLFSGLVPDPDLVFALDAPEAIILSRKRELTADELRRQRRVCLREAKKFTRACVLDSSRPVQELSTLAAQEIAGYLNGRYTQRNFSASAFTEHPCDPVHRQHG